MPTTLPLPRGSTAQPGGGIEIGIPYTYHDYEKRLVEIRKSSDTISVAAFTYDALGRRIEKVDAMAGTVTRYYYDDQRVLLETDLNGGTQVETDAQCDYLNLIRDYLSSGSVYYKESAQVKINEQDMKKHPNSAYRRSLEAAKKRRDDAKKQFDQGGTALRSFKGAKQCCQS